MNNGQDAYFQCILFINNNIGFAELSTSIALLLKFWVPTKRKMFRFFIQTIAIIE